jgi:tripartite-type tricarboxylate transporter receptor subunit TctC
MEGNAVRVLHQEILHLSAGALALLCAVPVVLSGPAARAETMTIKVVVPNPPGASTDILARLLAEQIGRSQGATLVVENRPGAGNVIGSEFVSRSVPDGRTLLINANPFVIDPHVRKLNYDPLTSFEPICHLASSPTIIVVNVASQYRTLADLLGAARAAPGTLTMASVGPATAGHIGFEMLKRAAKVDMTFVPYAGNPPAINALLGEHVTAALTGYAVVTELVKASKLRVLATTTRTRIEALPEVPTVAELGYEDYAVDFWIGVVAPAKTPKETVSQLARWFAAALQVPEVTAKLVAQGLYPVGACGAEFAAFIRRQYDDYGRAIHDAHIKAN